MKVSKLIYLPALILSATFTMQACKAKKVIQQMPVQETPPPPPPAAQPKQETATPPPPPPPPVVEKPDYNFSNIQFEFNSGILKTASYPIMDKAVAEMKKDPSVRFVLSGNSSAEGTAEHNQSLSVERATAVKGYLVNSGISADRLDAKGWGESKPIADNKTEAGRILNRRVEIKKLD